METRPEPHAYQYTELEPDQIRIIHLQPGDFGSPLIASIQTVGFKDTPSLHAEIDLSEPVARDFEAVIHRLQILKSPEADAAVARLCELRILDQQVHQAGRALDDLTHIESQLYQQKLCLLGVVGDAFSDEKTGVLHALGAELDNLGSWGPAGFVDPDSKSSTESSLGQAATELSHLAWLLETDFREHLVYCATLLGSYEAVSYAWGSSIPTEVVLTSEGGCIPITTSLHIALQHLRHQDRPRRLWADAICIDQDNAKERTAQVAIMATIYRSAVRVIAWLGVPNQEESQNLAFPLAYGAGDVLPRRGLRNIARVEPLTMLRHSPSTFDHTRRSTLTSEWFLLSSSSAQDRLEFFSQKAYFHRLWVVQELLVADYAEVQCGFIKVPWRDIHESDDTHVVYNAIEAWLISSLPHTPNKLLALLVRLRDRKCKDPRDRIFAIYTLADLGESDRMSEANYGMTKLEIYRLATIECLSSLSQPWEPEDTGHLPHSALVLALAYRDHTDGESQAPVVPSRASPPFSISGSGSGAASQEYWPSWVPDFDNLANSADDRFWYYLEYGRNRVCSHPQTGRLSFEHKEDRPSELRLHVAYFGRIVAVSSDYSALASDSWKKWIRRDNGLQTSGLGPTNAIIETGTGRVLGNVSTNAIEGDLVAVLGGAPLPFVFRDTGEAKYLLLGDAGLDLPEGDFDAGLFWEEHERVWITVV